MGINTTSAISTSTSFSSNWSEECAQQFHLVVTTTNNSPQDPLFIIFAIPATIIILLTVFGNLLVLCFKARVGRTNTTLLVWNLGLTDFLVGVFVLPASSIHLITRKWIFGRLLCRFWVAADVTFCTCSVVTICVISVDRYLAVTRPLRYKSVVTKCKVISVMVIIWTFSSSILLTTVRWHQPNCLDESICFAGNEIRFLAHSVIFAFFLPASVTLTLYWRIYRLARQRQKALDRGFLMILGHNMNFLTNTVSQSLQLKVAGIYRRPSGGTSAPITTEADTFQTTLRVHFGRNNGMVEHQRRVLRTHERIAKTLGVVSCSFLFCWLPFFILYLTNYQCEGCIPPVIIDIASWLGYCNSMLNPIIYSFTVKEFKRSALRAVLPMWKGLHRVLPIFFKAPPEHAGARMSRTGNRAKARTRSFEHNRTQKSGFHPVKMPTKRRQTEPAVFAVNKNNKKRENGIVEEEMERIDEENNYDEQDYEITSERNRTGLGLNTTVVSGTCPTLEPLLEKKNGLQKQTDEPPNNRGNWFRRSKKWLFREASASTQKDLSSKSVPSFKENRKINGTVVVHSSDFPGGVSSNSISVCSVGGSAPVSVANGGINITEKPSSGSHCSVKVYCVTNEANV